VLLLALLAAGAARPAIAQQPPGVNLSWDDCQASTANGLNKVSTCSSNSEAAKTLFGSYVLPFDIQALTGNDIVIDICSSAATLPCWWNFTVAPRTGGYQMQFDAPCVNAFDYWSTIPGGATGSSVAALKPTNAYPEIRVTASCAVNEALAQPVLASTGEIYSFTFRLRHDGTVGCNGCTAGAVIQLKQIRVTQSGSPAIDLTTSSSRAFVLWQGGFVVPSPCYPITPAINKTWGMVKALYR
jgi:hypothetical protein